MRSFLPCRKVIFQTLFESIFHHHHHTCVRLTVPKSLSKDITLTYLNLSALPAVFIASIQVRKRPSRLTGRSCLASFSPHHCVRHHTSPTAPLACCTHLPSPFSSSILHRPSFVVRASFLPPRPRARGGTRCSARSGLAPHSTLPSSSPHFHPHLPHDELHPCEAHLRHLLRR
jgi:hypothetical protein